MDAGLGGAILLLLTYCPPSLNEYPVSSYLPNSLVMTLLCNRQPDMSDAEVLKFRELYSTLNQIGLIQIVIDNVFSYAILPASFIFFAGYCIERGRLDVLERRGVKGQKNSVIQWSELL
jgi:hypothetical protein